MHELTEDEFAVLLIAAQGESMIAMARWEKPIDSLVAKGLMFRHNKHNNTITASGLAAIEERDRHDAKDLAGVLTAEAKRIDALPAALTISPDEIANILANSLVSTARTVAAAKGIGEADAARELAHTILTAALTQLGRRP